MSPNPLTQESSLGACVCVRTCHNGCLCHPHPQVPPRASHDQSPSPGHCVLLSQVVTLDSVSLRSHRHSLSKMGLLPPFLTRKLQRTLRLTQGLGFSWNPPFPEQASPLRHGIQFLVSFQIPFSKGISSVPLSSFFFSFLSRHLQSQCSPG